MESANLDCTGGLLQYPALTGHPARASARPGRHPHECTFCEFHLCDELSLELPLEEARTALLATHLDEELLSHEHDYPLRLVVPGRRGFEWVKWITRVEVLSMPDPGQILSIFTSSFTDPGRGR